MMMATIDGTRCRAREIILGVVMISILVSERLMPRSVRERSAEFKAAGLPFGSPCVKNSGVTRQ